MKKYYTQIVPFELARQVWQAGYRGEHGLIYTPFGHTISSHLQRSCDIPAPTYGDVLDWLAEKDMSIGIYIGNGNWGVRVSKALDMQTIWRGYAGSFEEAAKMGIKKAMDLLNI